MTSDHVESAGLKVASIGRDGKRRYDRQAKRQLVEACLMPGVSVAGLALKHGINANLLRKWIKLYERRRIQSSANTFPAPFVEVVDVGKRETAIATAPVKQQSHRMASEPLELKSTSHLSAQMPNGVTLKLECDSNGVPLIAAMIEALGRCDVPSGR